MKKYTIGLSIIIASVLTLIILIGIHSDVAIVAQATSPAGSNFSTAKFYGVAINLANIGANGTSTSILNTDTNDRYITATKVGCENVGTSRTAYSGAGLANLQLTVGTTSTSAPASIPASLPVVSNFNLSTSSTALLVASSSLLTATPSATIWPTGTYLTFWVNATNTALCTVGVDTFGS